MDDYMYTDDLGSRDPWDPRERVQWVGPAGTPGVDLDVNSETGFLDPPRDADPADGGVYCPDCAAVPATSCCNPARRARALEARSWRLKAIAERRPRWLARLRNLIGD